MKALPAVTQFFKSHNNTSQPQLATATSIKTYKNSTFGITSLQYPSDWTTNETNTQSNGTFHIVTFYAPLSSYSSLSKHPPFVDISIFNPGNSQVVRSLSSYLQYIINSYSQGHPDYTTINSNTTAKLGGLPAYSLEFSYKNTNDNSTYRELELGTIISGQVFYLDYYANAHSFSKMLPTALKMINSLRVNSSAIAELTPPSSPSPSPANNAATSPSVTTPTYTKGHHSETISSGSFSLPPGGGVKDFSFSVPSNAVNPRLIGTYSVTGGILPLIDVHLLDSIGSYIINEVSPSGQIVKLLSPGAYTLQFQNNAVFAGETKNVEVDFSLEYDVLTSSQ